MASGIYIRTEKHKQKMSESHKGHIAWNKGIPRSQETKNKIRMKNIGKQLGSKNSMYGKKRPDLVALNKSRIGVPISEEAKKKLREKMLKYWESSRGIVQKKKISNINKEWAKNNPNKKIEAAKNGHKACPRVSSQEIIFQNELKKMKIDFVAQYEYKLGFVDIFISPNICLFVDGKYWHSFEKQKRKDITQNLYLSLYGFKVFRFWEYEINKSAENCIKKVLKYINNKTKKQGM